MNQERFIEHHEATWQRAEHMLEHLESGAGWDEKLGELPALYRRCCHHLALARQRQYGAGLEARLHSIALRGYRQLYGNRAGTWRTLLELISNFPARVRAHARLFWLASALFYLPALAMATLVLMEPGAIYSLLLPGQVDEYEAMHGVRPSAERGAESDFAMFGFYIKHNISIAFRTFAAGLFVGIGTIFVLAYNGLFLGGLLAHMVHAGSAVNLTSFVVTHGAFELTALVISGLAGLRLGSAVLTPGRLPRVEALRRAGLDCSVLISGATVMLVIAAFIEAFWSSSAWVTPAGKYASGTCAWLLVILYLARAGRAGDVGDTGGS